MNALINVIIRPVEPLEIDFLKKMLYECIFTPANEGKPPKNIIDKPELAKYIINFGSRDKDLCLVAEYDGRLIGAIWTRLFERFEDSYGFVNESTPELSMAVCKNYRGKGIGALLLKKIIGELAAMNFLQVSLSVDERNFAYHLYEKQGFVKVGYHNNSATMVKRLLPL